MPPATSCLGICRAALLTAITLMNLALTILMCLAITFGSGGRFQAILMGLDGFACLLPAAYWLHKIVFVNDHLFVRSIAIFGILAVLGFATVLLLLARSDQQDGMGLMNDFALLSHPATVIKVAIGMAILATLFSVMGFLVAQMGWMSHRMEQQSVRNHRNATQPGCITTTQSDNQTLRSNNASASTLYADIELGTKAGNRFNASPRDG